MGSADHRRGLRHGLGRVSQGTGDAEVHDFDLVRIADHHIGGLDVPVHNAPGVAVQQRTQHPGHVPGGFLLGQRTSQCVVDLLLQRLRHLRDRLGGVVVGDAENIASTVLCCGAGVGLGFVSLFSGRRGRRIILCCGALIRWGAVQNVAQCDAVHVLHHNVGRLGVVTVLRNFGLTGVVDADNVRVVQ